MGTMEKSEKVVGESKVLGISVGMPSQCIYRMIQGFLTHGILLCMVFAHGF